QGLRPALRRPPHGAPDPGGAEEVPGRPDLVRRPQGRRPGEGERGGGEAGVRVSYLGRSASLRAATVMLLPNATRAIPVTPVNASVIGNALVQASQPPATQ